MSLIDSCFAYWPMEANGLDQTPNALHLTATAITYAAGGPDSTNMAVFNGTSSLFTIPNCQSKVANHKASFNYWVKLTTDPPTGTKTGISFMSNTGNPSHYPYTDSLIYETFGCAVRKAVGIIPNDKTVLHMITITVDEAANEFKFYVNGAMMFQTTAGTWSFNSTGQTLGGYTAVNYLQGKMSHTSLYDTALSQVDITILYNNGFGTFYPFTLNTSLKKFKSPNNKKAMFNFNEEQIKSIVQEAYGREIKIISPHSFSTTSTTALVTTNEKYAFFGKVVLSTVAQVGSYTVKLEKTGSLNNGVNYNAEIPALVDTDLNGVLDIENQLFNKWSIDGSLASVNFYFIGYKIQFD